MLRLLDREVVSCLPAERRVALLTMQIGSLRCFSIVRMPYADCGRSLYSCMLPANVSLVSESPSFSSSAGMVGSSYKLCGRWQVAKCFESYPACTCDRRWVACAFLFSFTLTRS